jgi:hypothetical protein
MGSTATASRFRPPFLDWRAWYRAIATEDATITRLGPQHLGATLSRVHRKPIGALSCDTGVNIETIRYYERIGFMTTATGNGWPSSAVRGSLAFRSMKSATCWAWHGTTT